MKKKILIFSLIVAVLMCGMFVSSPVFADDGCDLMIFTDWSGDCSDGVSLVLNLVRDILSAGVLIAATIAIIVCGIQIMTAGGNSAQIEKAKKRILEIIIGVALFVAMNVGIMSFISPGA